MTPNGNLAGLTHPPCAQMDIGEHIISSCVFCVSLPGKDSPLEPIANTKKLISIQTVLKSQRFNFGHILNATSLQHLQSSPN